MTNAEEIAAMFGNEQNFAGKDRVSIERVCEASAVVVRGASAESLRASAAEFRRKCGLPSAEELPCVDVLGRPIPASFPSHGTVWKYRCPDSSSIHIYPDGSWDVGMPETRMSVCFCTFGEEHTEICDLLWVNWYRAARLQLYPVKWEREPRGLKMTVFSGPEANPWKLSVEFGDSIPLANIGAFRDKLQEHGLYFLREGPSPAPDFEPFDPEVIYIGMAADEKMLNLCQEHLDPTQDDKPLRGQARTATAFRRYRESVNSDLDHLFVIPGYMPQDPTQATTNNAPYLIPFVEENLLIEYARKNGRRPAANAKSKDSSALEL